jgi:hypothetical protein
MAVPVTGARLTRCPTGDGCRQWRQVLDVTTVVVLSIRFVVKLCTNRGSLLVINTAGAGSRSATGLLGVGFLDFLEAF